MSYQQGLNFRDNQQQVYYGELIFLLRVLNQKGFQDDNEDQIQDLLSYTKEYVNQNKEYIETSNLEQDLHDFEKDIREHQFDSIRWYSKETFFYQIINQTFRKRNQWGVFQLRYAIKNLQIELQKKQKPLNQYPTILYRGASLNQDQVNLFMGWNSKSQTNSEKSPMLLMLLGFTSTSSKQEVAMEFAKLHKGGSLMIIIEIHIDQDCKNLPIFIDAEYENEMEYLFLLNLFLVVTDTSLHISNNFIRVKTRIAKEEEVQYHFEKNIKQKNLKLMKLCEKPRYDNLALFLVSYFSYQKPFAKNTLPYLLSKNYENPSFQCQRYLLIARAYDRLNEKIQCEEYLQKFFEFKIDIIYENYYKDVALAYFILGYSKDDQTLYLESLQAYKNSFNVLQSKFPQDELIGSLYNQIGCVFKNIGDYEKAEQYFKKSILFKKALNKGLKPDNLRPTKNQLAFVYLEKNTEKLKLNKALKMLTKLTNEYKRPLSMIRLARVTLQTGDSISAKIYIQEAQKIFKEKEPYGASTPPEIEAEFYSTFGQICFKTQEYSSAKEYYQRAINIYQTKNIENIRIVVDIYRQYSELLAKLGEEAESNQYLIRADQIYSDLQDIREKVLKDYDWNLFITGKNYNI